MRMKLLAAAVITVALLVAGCPNDSDETATDAVIEYETAGVTRADITAEVVTDATVVAPPNQYAAIECSYCAPISRVFATVGQSLSEGDVIVELSHPDARAALDAAQVELQQAQERLQEARREYAADVASAEARLQAAQATERQTRSALQQAQEQTPPPSNLIQLQVEYERSHERRLRMEDRLEDARERMEEAMMPARRRVNAAEEAVADARAEQNRFMISTPIDGQLIELNVEPGDEPGRIGGSLAVVADLSTLRVHARLTEEQARQVTPGMPARITLPAVPNMAFDGKVDRTNTRMESEASGGEGQKDYLSIIPFENTRGEAKPQMKASVVIDLGTVTDVLAVPLEAVTYDDDGTAFVNVQVADGWDQRDVVLGLSDEAMVEVRVGLEEGDVVRLGLNVESST